MCLFNRRIKQIVIKMHRWQHEDHVNQSCVKSSTINTIRDIESGFVYSNICKNTKKKPRKIVIKNASIACENEPIAYHDEPM